MEFNDLHKWGRKWEVTAFLSRDRNNAGLKPNSIGLMSNDGHTIGFSLEEAIAMADELKAEAMKLMEPD